MQHHDPIFAQIEKNRAANERFRPYCQTIEAETVPGFDEALEALSSSNWELISTPPSSWPGLCALLDYSCKSGLKDCGEYAIQMVETLSQSLSRLEEPRHGAQ